MLRGATAEAGKRPKATVYQRKVAFGMLRRLLAWAPGPAERAGRKSTLWVPGAPGLRRVLSPADIMEAECGCAKGDSFAKYLAQDCKGLDVFIVTPTVLFEDEKDVLQAVSHAVKFQLLSGIRTTPIYPEDIVRGVVDEEDTNTLRVFGSYTDWARGPGPSVESPARSAGQATLTAQVSDQTDKHKLLWLCKLPM
jgi:hypothetical protein